MRWRPPGSHEDLHRVATAPSHVVARQITRLLDAEPQQTPAARAALRTVRDAVERGERDFVDQLACEMDAFWNQQLARQWSAVAAHAKEDITLRTRLLADYGMAGARESLHEAVCYGDGSLHLLDRLHRAGLVTRARIRNDGASGPLVAWRRGRWACPQSRDCWRSACPAPW